MSLRVLGTDGRRRLGFRWNDPTVTRAVEDVLRANGLEFTDGVGSDATRPRPDELAELT